MPSWAYSNVESGTDATLGARDDRRHRIRVYGLVDGLTTSGNTAAQIAEAVKWAVANPINATIENASPIDARGELWIPGEAWVTILYGVDETVPRPNPWNEQAIEDADGYEERRVPQFYDASDQWSLTTYTGTGGANDIVVGRGRNRLDFTGDAGQIPLADWAGFRRDRYPVSVIVVPFVLTTSPDEIHRTMYNKVNSDWILLGGSDRPPRTVRYVGFRSRQVKSPGGTVRYAGYWTFRYTPIGFADWVALFYTFALGSAAVAAAQFVYVWRLNIPEVAFTDVFPTGGTSVNNGPPAGTAVSSSSGGIVPL